MSGLDTLAEEGLDLQLLDGSSQAELIEWHPASGSWPDADATVLLWLVPNPEAGMVTHWAQPEGPAA